MAVLELVRAVQIQNGGISCMTPTQKQASDNWFQKEILIKISEVKVIVDESLKLGRENGEDIRKLRVELGVDGAHGRIPQIEQTLARLDRQQEQDHKEVLNRIAALEEGDHIAQGKKQLFNIAVSILCSSGAAVFMGWLATHMGWVNGGH